LKVAVVDCLATGGLGKKFSSVDVIGAGPRLVTGIIKSLGVECELMECETVLTYSSDPFKGFDVLMVSGMSSDVRSMAMVLGRWGSRGFSFAGGPASVEGEELLELGFTGVVWGEAEISLPILIRELDSGDLHRVPNLIFKDRERTVSNIVECYATEPILWSFEPDTESIRKYRYFWASRVYVEVVRGCSNFYRTSLPILSPKPVQCDGCNTCRFGHLRGRLACHLGIPPGCGYCLVPRLYGPARSRPVSKIVSEIEKLIDIGVMRVVLSAPDILDYGRDWLVRPEPLTDPRNPPANLDALETLLSEIYSIPKVSRRDIYVMVENVKPNLVTEEVAKLLGRYLKGTTVNLGLESGDAEHHVRLGRPSRVEEVLRAVKLLREAGLRPYVYAIYGLPGENWRTVRRTIKTLKKSSKLGAERVILYRFRPLKGSAFEGYEPPSPKDPKAVALKEFVKKLEAAFKGNLLGKTIKVAVVDSYRRGEYIGYTLPHGPVAVIKSGTDLRGKVVEVVVRDVKERYVICSPVGGDSTI